MGNKHASNLDTCRPPLSHAPECIVWLLLSFFIPFFHPQVELTMQPLRVCQRMWLDNGDWQRNPLICAGDGRHPAWLHAACCVVLCYAVLSVLCWAAPASRHAMPCCVIDCLLGQ